MAENKNAKTPADDGQPVAWMHNFIENNVITHIPADIGRHPDRWAALYKDPTPCKTCQALAMAVMNDQTYHEKVTPKQWVGLTDEEIQDLGYLSEKFDASNSEWFDRWEFARAIEQALKEKNR
jgi:urocanate hydratase